MPTHWRSCSLRGELGEHVVEEPSGIVRVGRSGHDAALHMHTFKHNKSQKQVSIRVKGSVKGCPVCCIVEYLAWRDSEKVGASQPVFVWNNVRPVMARQVAKAVKDILELLGEESTGYSTHSFRIGRATEEAVEGASDTQLRDLGRWKSSAFLSYIRPNGLLSG